MSDRGVRLNVRLLQAGPIPLNVELHCEPGELLVLVGPSGSGKSTILRSIAGLYHAREGKINCGDQVWFDSELKMDMTPQQRRVGMVFQHYALFPHLTAYENIMIALGHLAETQRPQRARELLTRVKLSGIRDRRPGHLSGGEQQRVALARALARDPGVLLLDEPFSAVDQVTRRKLRMELAELTRNLNIPIILVTHDLDEACTLGQRMCIVRGGHTLQEGAPYDVLHKPRDAEVARLMDVRNIFEGEVMTPGRNGYSRLKWGDTILELPYLPEVEPGEKVSWCVAPEQVLMHRVDRPTSRGEKENPVSGVISELLVVGGMTNVVVTLNSNVRLYMDVPPHVSRRNHLCIGDRITMSLLGDSIHLMPWRPDFKRRNRA